MIPVEEYISSLISEQFPNFYKTEGPDFIQFVKAYYEWMEESGNIIDDGRNLYLYRDIDDTLEKYLIYFKDKYMHGIPTRVLGDKRFLQKHILDIYRSKGSIEGLKLLFRLLYNEDVDVYIPSYDILKTSDGKWIERQYIEISYNENNANFQNQIITGASSGATALVETYEERIINNHRVYILYINSLSGNFNSGEIITYEGLSVNDAPRIIGSPSEFAITSSDPGFSIGDTLSANVSNTVVGEGLKFVVSDIRDSQDGIITFTLVDGGFGYSVNADITITPLANGTGADFIISSLSNTSVYQYNTDDIASYSTVPLASNDYGFPANTGTGTSNATHGEYQNTILVDAFTYSNVTVGTIETIQTTSAGTGYDGGVEITIIEPKIASAYISDGDGGFWGSDANVTGVADFGSGIPTSLRLVDSGFGYYVNNQIIDLYNPANTILNISGNILLDGVGKAEGFWKNTDGFLNSDKYLQDSYYYQEYSYEVRTTKSLDKYSTILKALIHPVGNELFGRVVIKAFDSSYMNVVSSSAELLVTGYESNTGVAPSLVLDFEREIYRADAEPQTFGGLITTTRASDAAYINFKGKLSYVANDEPRIDHDPVTYAPLGLLTEEARTNDLPYSEDLTQGAWATTNISTRTANAAIAPDGAQTAVKLTMDAGTGAHRIYDGRNTANNEWVSMSVFVKDGDGIPYLALTTDQSNGFVIFDITNHSVANNASGFDVIIEDYGNNWYRYGFTYQALAADANDNQFILFTDRTNAVSPSNPFDGDEYVYVWGAQAESGTYSTSYIRTTGIAATRAGELTSLPTSGWSYDNTDGTWLVSSRMKQKDANTRIVAGTGTTAVVAITGTDIFGTTDGTTVLSGPVVNGAIDDNLVHKVAVSYDGSGRVITADGNNTPITDATTPYMASPATIYIGGKSDLTLMQNGHIPAIIWYPSKLSNTDIIDLTT